MSNDGSERAAEKRVDELIFLAVLFLGGASLRL